MKRSLVKTACRLPQRRLSDDVGRIGKREPCLLCDNLKILGCQPGRPVKLLEVAQRLRVSSNALKVACSAVSSK